MDLEHIIVLCTCPDEATAQRIAMDLVTSELAACVNRLAAIRSTYRWQGRVENELEILLLIKTLAARYAAVEDRIKALHPYEVPEVIALPIVKGSAGYLAWLAAGSGAGNPTSGVT